MFSIDFGIIVYSIFFVSALIKIITNTFYIFILSFHDFLNIQQR